MKTISVNSCIGRHLTANEITAALLPVENVRHKLFDITQHLDL